MTLPNTQPVSHHGVDEHLVRGMRVGSYATWVAESHDLLGHARSLCAQAKCPSRQITWRYPTGCCSSWRHCRRLRASSLCRKYHLSIVRVVQGITKWVYHVPMDISLCCAHTSASSTHYLSNRFRFIAHNIQPSIPLLPLNLRDTI